MQRTRQLREVIVIPITVRLSSRRYVPAGQACVLKFPGCGTMPQSRPVQRTASSVQ